MPKNAHNRRQLSSHLSSEAVRINSHDDPIGIPRRMGSYQEEEPIGVREGLHHGAPLTEG